MSELTLADLNRRLAAAEDLAAATHAEIVALRSRASRSATALFILASIAALGWGRSTIHAQSAPEPLTVRAPFVIVNKAGRPIMEVNEFGEAQGFLIRNSRGMVATQVGTSGSGTGMILVRDGTTPDGAPHPEKSGLVGLMVKDGKGVLQVSGTDGAFVTIKQDAMKIRAPVLILDSLKKSVVDISTEADDGGDRGIFLMNANKKVSAFLATYTGGSGGMAVSDGKGSGMDSGMAVLLIDKDGNGAFGLKAPSRPYYAKFSKRNGLRILDDSQDKPAVQMNVDAAGRGHISVLQEDKPVAQINADAEGRGHISVLESGVDRVSLAITSKKNAAIIVANGAGARVAELGSSHDLGDGGSLVIRDADGAPAVTAAAVEPGRGQVTVNSGDRAAASMVVLKNGLGALQAFNRAGQAVSVISSGARGDGLMQLTNAEGQAMVEAGTVEYGVGVVRTGPMGRKSGTAMLGMPGSFLVGRKEY